MPKYCKVNHEAHIVPLNKNLKVLIQNSEIRNNIDNPIQHEEGHYRTILEGQSYRDKVKDSGNERLLAVVLYQDEIGLTQPIGSRSKTQKMMMIYYTLGNIHPQNRSTLNSIELYGIVKSQYLKIPGAFNKVLAPFVKDIKILKNDGINITVQNKIKNYKGTMIFGSGDTPASALLGGFKESVAAYRLCRTCTTTEDQ